MEKIKTYKVYQTPSGEKVVAAPGDGGILLYTLSAWKYEEAPSWELIEGIFYPINQQGKPFRLDDLQKVKNFS